MAVRKSNVDEVEDEESSSLDDILGGAGDHDGDDGDEEGGGLELDDSQATEIRQIFLITLPQYLDPVEQMLDQLFGGEAFDSEIHQALETTLASISEAAARIAINDIYEVLERMRKHSAKLDEDTCVAGSLVHKNLLAELANIKKISGGGDADSDAPKAQTIVEAFRGKAGIDKSALEKLTAAGLVTVDQLKMARLDEIAAVTGLDMAVVKRLVSALGAEPEPRPAAQVKDSRPATKVKLPVGESNLDPALEAQLRQQVEVESEMEDTRHEVADLGARIARLRESLESANRRRTKLAESLNNAEERVAGGLSAQGAARAKRLRAEKDLRGTSTRLRELKARFAELNEERKIILSRHHQVAEEMADLVGRVKKVLERTSLSIPEHTFRTSGSSSSPADPIEDRPLGRRNKAGRKL